MVRNLFLLFACLVLSWEISAQTRTITSPDGESRIEITRIKGELVKVEKYNRDGQVFETGYYLGVKRHGNWQAYGDQGELMTNAYFYNDKKDGVWTINDPYSGMKHIVYFHNNRLLRMESESLVMLYR